MGDPESNTIALYREIADDMYLPGLLYENLQFRDKFEARMNELLNGLFSYDVLHDRLMEWDVIYRDQNIATLMRYQNMTRDEAALKYQEEINKFDSFLKNRKDNLLTYLYEDLSEFG
jgi:hypothetical protein